MNGYSGYWFMRAKLPPFLWKGPWHLNVLLGNFCLGRFGFFLQRSHQNMNPWDFIHQRVRTKHWGVGWFSTIFGMGVGCGQFFSITNYSSFVFACLCFNNQLSGNKGEVGSHYWVQISINAQLESAVWWNHLYKGNGNQFKAGWGLKYLN